MTLNATLEKKLSKHEAVARRAPRPHYPRWEKAKGLTASEFLVYKLIALGASNKSMADVFEISIKTVEKHRQSVYAKLGINNAIFLTHYALAQGDVKNYFVKA
jgi:DNA-binding NarL/FixJ family response regulator